MGWILERKQESPEMQSPRDGGNQTLNVEAQGLRRKVTSADRPTVVRCPGPATTDHKPQAYLV